MPSNGTGIRPHEGAAERVESRVRGRVRGRRRRAGGQGPARRQLCIGMWITCGLNVRNIVSYTQETPLYRKIYIANTWNFPENTQVRTCVRPASSLRHRRRFLGTGAGREGCAGPPAGGADGFLRAVSTDGAGFAPAGAGVALRRPRGALAPCEGGGAASVAGGREIRRRAPVHHGTERTVTARPPPWRGIPATVTDGGTPGRLRSTWGAPPRPARGLAPGPCAGRGDAPQVRTFRTGSRPRGSRVGRPGPVGRGRMAVATRWFPNRPCQPPTRPAAPPGRLLSGSGRGRGDPWAAGPVRAGAPQRLREVPGAP